MKAIVDAESCILDVSGQKNVELDKWIKIEPCLPYLLGGEVIGKCVAMC